MKNFLLLFPFCVLMMNKSKAQTTIILEEDSRNKGHLLYDYNLSDVYFVTSEDTFLLPQIKKMEFTLTNDRLQKLETTKDSLIQIIIETPNYYLKFFLEKTELKRYVPLMYIELNYIPKYKACNAYIRDYYAISRVLLAYESKKKSRNRKIYR